MSNYTVSLDRKATKLHFNDKELKIPLSPNSSIWRKLAYAIGCTKDFTLTDEARDALDIAYMVYVADRNLPRGEREGWIRSIHFCLTLRDPEKFKQIESDLKLTLSVLGGDNVTFTVSEISKNEDKKPLFKKRKNALPDFTDIALISGGQDSASGAIQLLNQGRLPLFVKVSLQDGSSKNEIKALLKAASKKSIYLFSQPLLTPEVAQNSDPQTETSQRLRSFFFLTLATVIGQTYSIEDIYINENGIMAIHLPLDPSRSSTFSTRTAYPTYTNNLERVFVKWLSYEKLKIKNLHVLKTKTEVIREAVANNGKAFMSQAISCAHSSTVKRTFKMMKSKAQFIEGNPRDIHCGYCFPCILRRISMYNAGLEGEDVKYVVDPFKMVLEPESDKYDSFHEASSAVLNLIRFLREIERKNELEMCFSFPQVIESSKALGLTDAKPIVDLHQRFSLEAKEYLADKAKHLLYLFDDKKSEEVHKRIIELADEKVLYDSLDELGNYEVNEYFMKQVFESFNQLKVYLQVSIANEKVSKEELQISLKNFLKESIPSPSSDGSEIQLNQNEGYEFKRNVTQGCKTKCWPFNKAG